MAGSGAELGHSFSSAPHLSFLLTHFSLGETEAPSGAGQMKGLLCCSLAFTLSFAGEILHATEESFMHGPLGKLLPLASCLRGICQALTWTPAWGSLVSGALPCSPPPLGLLSWPLPRSSALNTLEEAYHLQHEGLSCKGKPRARSPVPSHVPGHSACLWPCYLEFQAPQECTALSQTWN